MIRFTRVGVQGGLGLRVFSGLSILMMDGTDGGEVGRPVMEAGVDTWDMKAKAVEA